MSTISFFIYDTVWFDIRNYRYDTKKKDRYSHGRNRTVALRKKARDLIKVIGQGSKPALVSNRAKAKVLQSYPTSNQNKLDNPPHLLSNPVKMLACPLGVYLNSCFYSTYLFRCSFCFRYC